MFVKEANELPELNMISPLLTNMELVKCVSVHGGTSVYIVKSTKSNQSYYLKHICIPESQKQVKSRQTEKPVYFPQHRSYGG